MSKGNGRVWAFSGFLLGTAVSIAGNVAHTWHPSDEQLAAAGLTRQTAEQWEPEVGAQLFAAFFPVALLLTVEVLSRASWPSGKGWALARYGGTAAVALVAAVASYRHLYSLLRAYGEDELNAIIGPLAVDGLMVVCGFALLAISRHKAAEEAADTATRDMAADIAPDTVEPVSVDVAPDMPALGVGPVSDGPDITPTSVPGTDAPDTTADADTGGDMLPVPTRRKPRRVAVADADAVERARALLADEPDMSGAELGRRLELSERQGQRLVAAVREERREVAA